jgi:mannose-6-phosphate isomerase-like protein (cupin superfamily)
MRAFPVMLADVLGKTRHIPGHAETVRKSAKNSEVRPTELAVTKAYFVDSQSRWPGRRGAVTPWVTGKYSCLRAHQLGSLSQVGEFLHRELRGILQQCQRGCLRSHRHDLYEVFWISEGQGTCSVDFQPYDIQPPMLVFIAPGQVHSWKLTAPFAGHVILFTNEFFAGRSEDSGTYSLAVPFSQTLSSGAPSAF